MRNEELGPLLRIEEVAQRMNLKQSTIRKKILRREIDVVRISARAIRVPESWVNRAIANGFQKAVK